MTAADRIDHLSRHLEPIDVPTHYPPPHIKRLAARLSYTLGTKTVAWLFSRTQPTISNWRKQALQGEDDASLDRRQRGGTPRGKMCGTR